MKENRTFTVIFIIILTCFCAFILTFANIGWEESIKKNEKFARIESIVKTLGLCKEDSSQNEITEAYNKYVKTNMLRKMRVFEAYKEKRLVGTAIDVIGRGKYGLIKGMLAISENQSNIMAMDIYQQNETPGLGGRIATTEWLDQFKDLPLFIKGTPSVVISSESKGSNEIQGVTGASKTMLSIQKIINSAISRYFAKGLDIEELNLNLNTDTVTIATPGYKKNMILPPHLRKPGRRPAFMVASGLKNLAQGKPVICSKEDSIIKGELEQITDNVKKSGDNDYLILDLGLQWIQIDLEEVYNISAVVVWHFYKNAVIYNDVIIQISNDSEFKKNVVTLFNNDHDNSAGLGKGTDTAYVSRWWAEIADARGENYKGTPAQYVRVYTAGDTANEETKIVEVAVYGK